ncbi:MAG: ATP-dependent zinc metalloprotease FtsH [Erysipelotrichaceae bacterium]|nr:ATP-dependent zinc metalloprotease FtsH [Erysipelotrichaceae bacterium]
MKNKKWMSFIPYLFTTAILVAMFTFASSSKQSTLSYGQLINLIESKQINQVQLTMNSTVIDVKGTYTEKDIEYIFVSSIPNNETQSSELMELLKEKVTDGNIKIVNPYKTNVLTEILAQVIPMFLLVGLCIYMFSKVSMASNNKAADYQKSRARLEGDIKVRFNDVAGCDEEKEEMQELIEYLVDPKKFTAMGARIPKGVLLVGPPGTGKTLLAKAVAGEADVPFYSISGSDFVELFVGVGASRVRDMFKTAKKTAPCIIFIDEIDAVGRQRGAGLGGGNDEREQTLNQLLVEMDGISENVGIVIIAATNRPDVLDPALLRPGRFDRQITVSLPDRNGREAILKVHARNKILSDNIDLGALADRTPGFSGADLENVLNEAAIMAVRNKHEKITMEDLDEAIDRTMSGPAKKSRKYSPKEKHLVSVHEAGHAVIGLFLESADRVEKVTIIPRGMAGGYNMMTPKEERFFLSKSDLEGRICGLLGGRAAEEIVLNEISTGASNDIERATKIAQAMVNAYGMSPLGPIQYAKEDGNVFLGRDYTTNKSYSDKVAAEIDQQVRVIINDAHKMAIDIINQHRDVLDNIVANLEKYETLTKEDIDYIVKNGCKDFRQAIETVE